MEDRATPKPVPDHGTTVPPVRWQLAWSADEIR